jgi:hypothetical protein
MKTILTLISICILSLASIVHGNEPAKIELKNKSSFTMDAGSRNPFWPIGWKPAIAKISGSSGDQAGEIPVTAFVVSTITLDQGTHFAIINGRAMQEGQQFGLLLGTQTYQIVVKKIEDGRVILAHHDEEIVIPLRRK